MISRQQTETACDLGVRGRIQVIQPRPFLSQGTTERSRSYNEIEFHLERRDFWPYYSPGKLSLTDRGETVCNSHFK